MTTRGDRNVLFDIERSSVLGRPGLRVRGELDIATAPQLTDAVMSLLSQAPRALVVDLTPTTFLDSSGARTLAFAARRARAAGTALEVVCPRGNRAVWLVLDLLELQAVVPIVESPTLSEPEVGP
ncbi:STAS domain-containing protein [Geodermatophilus marinus]|uniref:STAS domain-containing protein n=1 Tax=Geodermatophilus sp. LHW52908 TaxID=2303986 RepID=UPI001314257C|nr:STAS domain-containing protein [Geodermatophilus sp. LHW52908]